MFGVGGDDRQEVSFLAIDGTQSQELFNSTSAFYPSKCEGNDRHGFLLSCVSWERVKSFLEDISAQSFKTA